MNYLNKEIESCHKEYVRLLNVWKKAISDNDAKVNIFNRKRLAKQVDNAKKEYREYCQNIYAKAVFEEYSKTKPVLIDVDSGEEVQWDALFGKKFDSLDVFSRNRLVSLIEEDGGYKIK